MKRKSKFLTFILSFIPGLSHVYLGFLGRGAIFFTAFFGDVFLILFLEAVAHYSNGEFLGILLPFIWLIALVDSMSLAGKINNYPDFNSTKGDAITMNFSDKENIEKQNKKIIAMLLSIIPGAGHMYLGMTKQGLQLMSLFFLSFYLTDWLRISLFMVFVPLIWFFSLFDVMHKISGTKPFVDEDLNVFSWLNSNNSWIQNKSRFFGYALIILGFVIIFERIIFPTISRYISFELSNNLQTGIVAVLFIIGGIKLLSGKKIEKQQKEGAVTKCDNGE